jgi:lipoprotein-releasing system permease protein
MKPELYIARRFAFKPRSHSKPTFIVLISVIGIAVGTAALILTLSIVKGFAGIMEVKLISFNSHLQIRQPDDRLFPETRRELQSVLETEGIASASPFLEIPVMLRSRPSRREMNPEIQPAVIKGITPGEKARFLKKYRIRGGAVPADSSETLSLAVGKALAEKLGLSAGSRVMLVGAERGTVPQALSHHENIVDLLTSLDLEVARVDVIYDTGLYEGFDDLVVLADLQNLQRRFHPGMISGYEADVSKLGELPAIAERVTGKLGFPFYSYTVYQRYANLFEWLKLQKNIMPLLIITITVVAVFNIVSTLLVLIIEKTREIGMLGALGLEPRKISMVFMTQALMIALVGIAAGDLLALALSLFERHFQLISLPEKSYFIKHVPILINPVDYLAVSGGIACLTLVFSFIPSRVAGALKPCTALTS